MNKKVFCRYKYTRSSYNFFLINKFQTDCYPKSENLIYKNEFPRAYTKDKRAEERGKLRDFFPGSMHYSCYEIINAQKKSLNL